MKNRLVSLPNYKLAAKRSNESPINYKKLDLTPSNFLINWAKNKRFFITTYGCQANVRDSEILKAMLLKINMVEATSFNDADFILFNTCAIRENAENHLYGELGRCKDKFNKDKNTLIAICGCMMQEESAIKYIHEHFPFVKLIFGTNNINDFYNLLTESLKDDINLTNVISNSYDVYEGYSIDEIGRENKVTAFVNIMYGCDKFCTYCVVPYTRGKERSRRIEDILLEVNTLKEKGYKQVTLLGQNVDAYGKDFKDGTTFYQLLEEVAKTNIPRIRFVTPYPSDFNIEVFKVMAKYKNIMPYIHLPVQSGSDRILRLMNRRYTKEEYLQIVKDIRNLIPDIFLSTDIIVGFPNETDEDFKETLDIVKKAHYDSAYTFIFSSRPGTPASKMKNSTPIDVIHRRFDELKDLIDYQTQLRAEKFVGTIQEVLFEKVSEKDPSMISGYDRHNKLVHVKGDSTLIGQIKKIKILESHTFSLIGEIIDE